MNRRGLIVALLVLGAMSAARATDQTVLGNRLSINNPGAAAKRKITVKAKETATDDTLVGDPVAQGASVTVTANGGMPSSQTYPLPTGTSAVTQRPFWTGDASRGFKYKDTKGENGPVKSAQIKRSGAVFQIKVLIDGKLAPVNVLPPNPGTDGCVLVEITGGDSYSIRFADGRISSHADLRFDVSRPLSEGSCIPTTTTTTTSTTTTTLVPIPDRVPPGAAPLRYRDAVFPTVQKTADVVFGSAVNGSGQTVTLRLDVYEPIGDTITSRPAIVWVHGGSFSSGDKSSPELVDQANTFSMKGFVNVSINYRLEPGGCSAAVPTASCVLAIQEAILDSQAAVSFLRTNAATYGIDPTRIAMGGSSAGAITALHVGFLSSETPASAIGAALSLSGGRITGPVDIGDAPSLLFHTTGDAIVPYQWAVNTVNAAAAVGLDSFLTTWTGTGHVPYVQHRTEILTQSTNFLYWELDLATAAQ